MRCLSDLLQGKQHEGFAASACAWVPVPVCEYECVLVSVRVYVFVWESQHGDAGAKLASKA